MGAKALQKCKAFLFYGLLIASEKRYSELLQLSPLPKLVFDLETLQSLDVNEASVRQYSYTKDEFLQMTMPQLRPPENWSLYAEMLTELKQKLITTSHYAFVHQKKNREKISVDLWSNPVLYKEKNTRIAVSKDITESLNYIHEIKVRNENLKEIS